MEAIISRAWYNSDPDSLNCALVPRPCIAMKLPQGVLGAAPRTTLWVARTQRFLSCLGLKAKAPQPNTVVTLSLNVCVESLPFLPSGRCPQGRFLLCQSIPSPTPSPCGALSRPLALPALLLEVRIFLGLWTSKQGKGQHNTQGRLRVRKENHGVSKPGHFKWRTLDS